MISGFVGMLMASAGTSAAPAAPVSALVSSYGASLVKVTWVNGGGGANPTRLYVKVAGVWTLTGSADAGNTAIETGYSIASGYTFGVSHYNATTGLESAITEALPPAPPSPTGLDFELYAGTKVQLNWTANGSYATRCYRIENGVPVLKVTLSAGVDSWASGYFTASELRVSHYNPATGQESDKVGVA